MSETYVGNPANDPQAITVFDDSDLRNATNLNLAPEALADSIAYLRGLINGRAGVDWRGQIQTWTTYEPVVPPVWDPAFGRWLAPSIALSGAEPFLLQSFDGLAYEQWTGNLNTLMSQTSGTLLQRGIIPRATDGTILVLCYDNASTVGYTIMLTPTGGHIAGFGPFTPDTGAHAWWEGAWNVSTSSWVTWEGSVTTAPYWSPDGSTWNAATTWGVVSGFEVHHLASFSGVVAGTFAHVIFPAGTTPVSEFAVSFDGKNWSAAGMPTLPLSGEAVIDASLDSATSTIYLMTGTSSVTHIWASQAFGSWALVATLNRRCWALKAASQLLVAWTEYAGQGPSMASIYRPIVSTNGGVTWSAPTGLGTITNPAEWFSLRSSGQQILYNNTAEYAASGTRGMPAAGVV